MISLSVVSHGQVEIANELLRTIADIRPPGLAEVIYTRNIPEPDPAPVDLGATRLILVDNIRPKGFGANHNAAFARASQPGFCVCNPDIRLIDDPFTALQRALDGDPQLGVVAPLVLAPDESVENTARRLYTPIELLMQKLRPRNRRTSADWLAGMFLLFRADAYRQIGGFDESYFMYIEDVDICTRLRVAGHTLQQVSGSHVIHAAQKRSHRSLTHMRWHLTSMFRYWSTPGFRDYRKMLRARANSYRSMQNR